MSLAGKTALVTGSSSGIGRGIALAFAREGANVIITGRNEERIAQVVQEVEASGAKGMGLQADVARFGEVQTMVEKAQSALGSIDILVNNAGVFSTQALHDMTEQEWDDMIAVDLKSVFNCTRAVIKDMRTQGWGRVICITGLVGNTGYANTTHVAAAKAGVHGFVKALAREVIASGITVNAITPGLIDTPILAGISEAQMAVFTQEIPAGRIGSVEEITAATSYLASEAAGYNRPDSEYQWRRADLGNAEL
jgi:3-oxoacyl-[acyl-carrier protein] reductase